MDEFKKLLEGVVQRMGIGLEEQRAELVEHAERAARDLAAAIAAEEPGIDRMLRAQKNALSTHAAVVAVEQADRLTAEQLNVLAGGILVVAELIAQAGGDESPAELTGQPG